MTVVNLTEVRWTRPQSTEKKTVFPNAKQGLSPGS